MAEMFIGGESVDAPALERQTIASPASGEPVDTVPVATAAEVDRAVRAAQDAFEGWWQTSAARRGELVHHAARHVLEHTGELARLLTDEQGKPLRESRLEIHRFVLTLEHYAGLAKNLRGAYVPNLDKDTYGLVTKRPLGVVGAIVPWNFPTTLLANKLAPALVAGNTVVAKPPRPHRSRHFASPSCCTRPGCPPACSTSSPAGGAWWARRWCSTRSCGRSASPARRRPASGSWSWPLRAPSGSRWSSAARTR